MLNSMHGEGFSLIELLLGITITGILLVMGVPSFKSWIQNAQIRTATEAIQNGLEMARAEAVRRNTLVRFQFTTTLDNNCARTTASGNWVISRDDPTGNCAGAKLSEAYPISDTVNNPTPAIIQLRLGREGSANAVVTSQEVTPAGTIASSPVYTGSLTFNGVGRISTNPASVTPGNNVQIAITNPTVGGACMTTGGGGGPMRCLRIVISSGGLIRSCNPLWQSSYPSQPYYDPQGC